MTWTKLLQMLISPFYKIDFLEFGTVIWIIVFMMLVLDASNKFRSPTRTYLVWKPVSRRSCTPRWQTTGLSLACPACSVVQKRSLSYCSFSQSWPGGTRDTCRVPYQFGPNKFFLIKGSDSIMCRLLDSGEEWIERFDAICSTYYKTYANLEMAL